MGTVRRLRCAGDIGLPDDLHIVDLPGTTLSSALVAISGLWSLRVDTRLRYYENRRPLMAWLCQVLRQSPNLEVVAVSLGNGCSSEFGETLQHAGIKLKELCFEGVDAPLLRYLASYSGLKRLQLSGLSSLRASGEFFFATVLPKHADTLIALTCLGHMEGSWSIDQQNIAVISQMRRLDALEVTVNSCDMRPGSPTDIVVSALMCPESN
jgi:hypothetical protein